MSVASIFVTRLGRTQLGRSHENTLILLRITFLAEVLFELTVTPPRFDWWHTFSRTNASCFPGRIVVS